MELLDIEAQKEFIPCECHICYEIYNITSQSREPKTLMCGHTVCLHCLKRLVCKSKLLFFVVCPFCRRVTVVPEKGVQALKTDDETLRRASMCTVVSTISEDDNSDSLGYSSGRSSPSPSADFAHSSDPTIFTVSSLIPTNQGQFWGGRYMQEIRSTYLLGIARRVALSEAHPSPTPSTFSTDSLRICFALGLILSIACVFFILVFYK